jgi:hypothetical protein
MFSALVPGRILRSAAWSRLLNSFCCSGDADTGESWSSGMGGGLGRRGEAGDVILEEEWVMECAIAMAADVDDHVGGVWCVVDIGHLELAQADAGQWQGSSELVITRLR